MTGRAVRRRSSALLVPVPEAEAAVGEWRQRADPSAAKGVPAHITVLYPFLRPRRVAESDHEGLARAAASVPAFDYTLRSVGRFPGVVYLAPEPAGPFAALLKAVQQGWPGLEPYGGRFDSYVPHLTVSDGQEPDGMAAAVEAALPISARAEELVLMVEDRRGRWSPSGRFPLG